MPCRYDVEESLGKSLEDANEELDQLTRLLCEACRIGSPGSGQSSADWSPELKDWWSRHQVADENRRRVELEQLRQREIIEGALTKLSDEEIKALGIKQPPKPPSREVRRAMQRKSI